ncbi:hypothetical protein Hanom_Chr04g00309671 [Helianthus anomalus]
MHVGSHVAVDSDALEAIGESYFIHGLVVVDRPTLLGFWQVVVGEDTWEHDKVYGRISHVDDPLYRMLATSIIARGHSREWYTSTDVFFFYCLLYSRPCALAHGLAQYFASAHPRQKCGFLYGGTFVNVIARSLGHLPEADPQLLRPITLKRLSF